MAGDTLRDAWRAELAAVVAAASPAILWTVRDTLNTTDEPDASTGYLELEFGAGDEEQFTFGAPGNNLWRERAPVFVNVVAPLGQNRDLAETYASQIRRAFRGRRFAAGGRSIRVTGTAPMGGGQVEGGNWVESIALAYEIFNIG